MDPMNIAHNPPQTNIASVCFSMEEKFKWIWLSQKWHPFYSDLSKEKYISVYLFNLHIIRNVIEMYYVNILNLLGEQLNTAHTSQSLNPIN